MDCYGNPIGPAGSGGAGANVPPTNMPTMGGYRDPATGLFSSTEGGNRGAYNPASGDEDQNDGIADYLGARNHFFGAASKMAGAAQSAGNFAAGFNPIANAVTAATGQDASGHCVSRAERAMAALSFVPAAAIERGIGAAAKGLGKLGKGLGKGLEESQSLGKSTAHFLPGADKDGQLPLFTPEEYYKRRKHYGNTPNTAQTNSVPEGMSFDHEPPLVQHYYEGDGNGSIPGYMMTQKDREAHGKAVQAGKAATSHEQDVQGAIMRGYSVRMRKYWFGPSKKR